MYTYVICGHMYYFITYQKQTTTHREGEGTGNPLQYSCLENPMDGGPGRLRSMGLRRVGHD